MKKALASIALLAVLALTSCTDLITGPIDNDREVENKPEKNIIPPPNPSSDKYYMEQCMDPNECAVCVPVGNK